MLFEILIIVVALVFVVQKLQQDSARFAKVGVQARVAPAPTAQAVARVLQIEGTLPFTKPIGFVAQHGLNVAEIQDIRTFSSDNGTVEMLPVRVRECLQATYGDGLGRGLLLAEFLNHSRPLGVGEALYFALIHRPQFGGAIIAFIDKLR